MDRYYVEQDVLETGLVLVSLRDDGSEVEDDSDVEVEAGYSVFDRLLPLGSRRAAFCRDADTADLVAVALNAAEARS